VFDDYQGGFELFVNDYTVSWGGQRDDRPLNVYQFGVYF
jgi:hypothetical protein